MTLNNTAGLYVKGKCPNTSDNLNKAMKFLYRRNH
jgi:hypothetical protein